MCDFDGTITMQDTAEWILDKHADGDWRVLDELYVQGKIGLLECMSQQFSMVRLGDEQLLKELDEAISIRSGFPEMVDAFRAAGGDVLIVSAGLDFVIDHYMKRLGVSSKVKVYSSRTHRVDGHISFEFPPLTYRESKSFKDDVVRQWQSKGAVVTYIGDGTPDAEACALADYRFAVHGSKLEAIMDARKLKHVSFESFVAIIPQILKSECL